MIAQAQKIYDLAQLHMFALVFGSMIIVPWIGFLLFLPSNTVLPSILMVGYTETFLIMKVRHVFGVATLVVPILFALPALVMSDVIAHLLFNVCLT